MYIGNNNLDIIDNLERNVYSFVAHKYHTSVDSIKTNIIKSTKSVTKKDFDLSPKEVITEIVSNCIV